MNEHLQEEFDRDRELRLQREAELMKQLSDHEYVVSEQFDKQIVSDELDISVNRRDGLFLIFDLFYFYENAASS
jgi:hypothetical protein